MFLTLNTYFRIRYINIDWKQVIGTFQKSLAKSAFTRGLSQLKTHRWKELTLATIWYSGSKVTLVVSNLFVLCNCCPTIVPNACEKHTVILNIFNSSNLSLWTKLVDFLGSNYLFDKKHAYRSGKSFISASIYLIEAGINSVDQGESVIRIWHGPQKGIRYHFTPTIAECLKIVGYLWECLFMVQFFF